MVERGKQPQDEYQSKITGFGVTAKHLWLILGVNALISAAISLLVVLVVGPWAYSGAVSGLYSSPADAAVEPAAEGTPLDALATTTAMAMAAESPTPTQTPEPVLYEIVAGDSLSGIATQFGVSMDDIMTANGIQDPDALQAGRTIVIPVGGLVGVDPTATIEPEPTETTLPFDPPTPEGAQSVQDVSIKSTETPTAIPTATAPPLDQVMVSIDTVLGYGQLEEELIVIFNQGPGVNLFGWKLRSLTSESEFELPNLFLWNGGSVRIHTTSGTNTSADLYWGQAEARWFSGDTVELVNASGEVISSYVIP
jgi:LysM repeat protein